MPKNRFKNAPGVEMKNYRDHDTSEDHGSDNDNMDFSQSKSIDMILEAKELDEESNLQPCSLSKQL